MRTEEAAPPVFSRQRQESFPGGGPSHPIRLLPLPSGVPPRQLRLRNRSLFKSFMSTPQKRKACRKRRDRNEECVIAPLICNDLRHDGCNRFDNHSLFSLSREERYSQRFQPGFISPLLFHKRLSFFFAHLLPL